MVLVLGSMGPPILAEPKYAIGTISAVDGNPVKGVDAIRR